MTNRVETILNRWGLTEEEKTQLLGLPTSPNYSTRQMDIITIDLTLRGILKTPDLWFKKPNTYYGGLSALQYCLQNDTNLRRLKNYLEAYFR